MARLIVKLRGEEISKITMESGMEYIAGRSQDAQIPLAGERGISRHHLKFYERDGVWVCESLSKFVLIQKGNQSLEVIEMSEACVFSVTPYDFYFEPTPQASASAENGNAENREEKPSENLPVFYQPRVNQVSEDTSPKLNNEATMAGAAVLVPYFRISYPNTADDEVLKLEGSLWTAGRDPDCEIPIDSPHISRKHFELQRTKEGFFVTDLGSSNGTKINGQRIPAHEPTRLDSGDELRVMNVSMSFEIRDSAFSNRMDNLPVPAFDPMLAAPPMPWYPQDMNLPAEYHPHHGGELEEIPKDWRQLRPHHLKKFDWKKNKVRVALVALIPVVLFLALSDDKPKPKTDTTPGSNSVVFDNLTPEQRSVVKDSFNLARSLYVQGKYELCLAEVAKVHELIPQFENSKELQSFCEQGRELVIRQKDSERKERERQAIEQQISGYVENCKAKLTVYASIDETRQCLSEAMELDPEHSLIMEMIQNAQAREQERKLLALEKEKENQRSENGRKHYEKARNLWKNGKLAKAVNEYERFLDTPYPKVDGQKSTARRELASIKTELKSKIGTLLDQCKQLGGRGKFKEAYLACDKAVEEDTSNAEAKEVRTNMHNELKREMKNIYEDSVLEESLGNVDSAKEKWRKIMKENLDFDEYTKKARSKLRRYGIN